jgi:hypothetical protein
MHPKKFEEIFKRIAEIYTLDLFAEEKSLEGKFPKRNPSESIWDRIDDLHHEEYVDLGNGKFFPCRFLFKRPVRILFFILITEFEARLFRIHELLGKNIAELNNKNTNDLIRELLKPEIISLQKEYPSRKEFKEDLKALGAFRNLVVHTNKKLELSIEADTIFKRKKQILKVLCALQQISDSLKKNIL